jgi:hypothetical protein
MKMSIASSSVLVELNISVPSFRKLDKKTSDEVNVGKKAVKGASRVNVHLLAGTDKLEELHKFVGRIRSEFYYKTLPWSDSGQRLVPMAAFFDLTEWLSAQQLEFETKVAEFIAVYPTLISAQAFAMGTFFDRSQYPDPSEIVDKFKFSKLFLPVPESGDFRVDVDESLREQLTAEFSKAYDARTASAMNDIWNRLHEVLTHMSERLAPAKDGEKKIIRESLLGNAVELCDVLTRLNVTQDPALEKARKMLENTLTGVETSDLKDKRISVDVKAQVDSILASFNF